MSTYTINAGKQVHRLTEFNGLVKSCTIDFLEGLPFVTARSLMEQKGWTIIPDIEQPVNSFGFRGSNYELRWKDNQLCTILKDDEEITWQELPEQLKGLL
jgi:hypothetical protein